MLRIKNLCYKYPDGHEALKGINFSIKPQEKIALVGANGSGKSTLLLHIAGALKIQTGEIFFEGTPASPEELIKKTGLIFQDPDDQILMPSVLEDVAFSLIARGMKKSQALEKSLRLLESLGIEKLASRPPHKLSGGEKRMVSFAGVLAADPEVLLLDEPTAGLDPKARRRVINFLRDSKHTILLATHDLDMSLDVCSRAVILNQGRTACEGSLPDLFQNEKILEANGLELPLRFACRD